MTVRDRLDETTGGEDLADEFGSYLDEAKKDPAFRVAYEDAERLALLIDTLVNHRRACSLSQSEVARRMNIKQPTVSQFENEGSDPKLSTVQRYARAVGARLRFVVDVPQSCDWVSPSRAKYDSQSVSCEAVRIRCDSELPTSWSLAFSDKRGVG